MKVEEEKLHRLIHLTRTLIDHAEQGDDEAQDLLDLLGCAAHLFVETLNVLDQVVSEWERGTCAEQPHE